MSEKVAEEFADYRTGRTSYFKVDRNIIESSLWTMPDTDIRVFIYLLAKSNWEPRKWWDKEKKAEVLVPRGSFITSIQKIAEANGKSKATIQHCLARLIKTGRIEKSGTAYSFISIINYDFYQQDYKDGDTLEIRQRYASDTLAIREVVTTKEVKNNNIKENTLVVEEIWKDFQETVCIHYKKNFRLTEAVKKKIIARLKVFGIEDFKYVHRAVVADDWADREKHCDPSTIYHSDVKFERWRNRSTTQRGKVASLQPKPGKYDKVGIEVDVDEERKKNGETW